MRILWTKKAEKHLTGIYNYIAEDSPYYASRTIERIVDKAETVKEFPKRGRQVPEYHDESVREVLLNPYRIIYQIGENHILIVSILHQARDRSAIQEKPPKS